MITKILKEEGHDVFLCERENSDQIDRISSELLAALSIDGVLYADEGTTDGRWRYDLTDLISVKEYMKTPREKEKVLQILTGVRDIMADVENCMIPAEQLLLGTEQVFVDEDGLAYMVVSPVVREKLEIGAFVREMTEAVVPIPGFTCRYRICMHKFAEEFAGREASKQDFDQLLREISESKEESIEAMRRAAEQRQQPQAPQGRPWGEQPTAPQQPQVPQGQPLGGQPAAPHQPVAPQGQSWGEQPAAPQQQQAPQGQSSAQMPESQQQVPPSMAAGETVVLTPAMAGTVVWNNLRGMLTRQRTGEHYIFDKPETYIGKDYMNVDFFIQGNSAISRRHAKVENRADKYFLSDNHSTNHTYVNGRMLMDSEECELQPGDIVKLADETFLFQMV